MAVRLQLHITSMPGLLSFCDGLLKVVRKGWQGPDSVSCVGFPLSDGAALSKAVKHCDHLIRLELKCCSLSNLFVTEIAKSLPFCKSLSNLSLRYNLIGDDGAQALSRNMPLCTGLVFLDLSNNIIGDPGCKALIAAVPHCCALADIKFGGNGIGRGLCSRLQNALDLRKAIVANTED
jgi:hypothetical protein